MLQETVNTFNDGLDTDSSRDRYPNTKYLYGRNVDILTNSGLSNGDLTNTLGNELRFEFPDTLYRSFKIRLTDTLSTGTLDVVVNTTHHNIIFTNYTLDNLYTSITIALSSDISSNNIKVIKDVGHIYICGLLSNVDLLPSGEISTELVTNVQTNIVCTGAITIRDIVILFTNSKGINNVPNSFQIWKVNHVNNGYSVTNTLNKVLVLHEHLMCNNTEFNFPLDSKVRGKGNYETPEVIKIYFTDANNKFRHINIQDENNISYDISRFNLIADVDIEPITVVDNTNGGTYKAGMVQFSYYLFNLHGSQTCFAPVTPLYHVTGFKEMGSSKDYKGGTIDTVTNTAFRLRLTNIDRSFSHIRIISLHYNSEESTPSINIVSEQRIPENGILEFIDIGNSIGTVTLTEFKSIGSVDFKYKSSWNKDNILFVGNIEEDFFDVNWDARAYRFDSSGNSRVTGSSSVLNFTKYSWLLPEEHDCIQDKSDQSTHYKYNLSNDLGGEGPNIVYDFTVKKISINDYAAIDAGRLEVNLGSTSEHWAIAKFAADYTGYMRDEIYSFGIVFFNSKGQQSFVKWIADIKFPAIGDSDLLGTKNIVDYNISSYSVSDGKTYAYILGIRFKLKSLPEGAVGYRIVRCKREEWDKTVLLQGVWKPMIRATNSGETFWCVNRSFNPFGKVVISNKGILISPEISFLNNYKLVSGDYIRLEAILPSITVRNYITTFDGHDLNLHVHNSRFTSAYTFNNIDRNFAIVDGSSIKNSSAYNKYIVNNSVFINYWWDPNNVDTPKGFSCHNFAFHVNREFNYQITDVIPLVNLCRDIIPYGGNTYSSRTFRSYIPCTQLIKTINSFNQVFAGDTYVDMFDNFTNPSTEDDGLWKDAYVNYFPVETTINLSLRNDSCFSKSSDYYRNWLHEPAGTYGPLVQAFDLYLYNRVYSHQGNAQTYTPRPLLLSDNNTYDSRIMASLVKVYGESIDSWTRFLPENVIDVQGEYGSVNALIEHDNKLIFAQDRAFGIVAVNEKILSTPDDAGESLILGKSGILDSFTYINVNSGCISQDHICFSSASKDSLFYYDYINNTIMLYTDIGKQYSAKKEAVPISVIKGITTELKSLLDNNYMSNTDTISGNGILVTRYPLSNRVLFTFVRDNETYTLAFNTVLQCFEGPFDFGSKLYYVVDNALYGFNNDTIKSYVYGKGNRCQFFDQYYQSELKYLPLVAPLETKVYTNLEYNMDCKDSAGLDLPFVHFDSFRVYNNYQDTGLKQLVFGTNCNRRMRMWRITIPRNANTTERIKSQSAIVHLRFTNSSNISFVLEPITTKVALRSF